MNFIKKLLKVLSLFSIPLLYFFPSLTNLMWDLSLIAVFILMMIRPLHDLFPRLGIGKYISLRKELGIFSATIVVALGFFHYISPDFHFFQTYFSLDYWTFEGSKFWAHLGELTGFILLITSNMYSMKLLKRNWKRVQRLSYVYFFSGAWYVYASFDKLWALIAMIIIFELTLAAYIKKRIPKDQVEEIPLTPQVQNFQPQQAQVSQEEVQTSLLNQGSTQERK